MQLRFSPSMRSITISSSNGFIDLMKIKVAARHISYRTLFHTILILAFLLPFVFILTAVVTLEGVNKCSSFGILLIFLSFFSSNLILLYEFWFLVICDRSWFDWMNFTYWFLSLNNLIGFVIWVSSIQIEIWEYWFMQCYGIGILCHWIGLVR